MTMKCGLVGHKLSHSFSPQIHRELADYSYQLFELEPEELEGFFTGADFDGVNVTIPYKKAAMEYCTRLTDIARRIGCVNTVVRRPDGTLLGHNTDYEGFMWLVRSTGVSPAGKKALVLGSGGACLTACTALKDMGAAETVVVSRSGSVNYDNVYEHSDAAVLVNTTPVGMYPNNGACLVEPERLPGLECVIDVVYNPSKTELLLRSERLNIKCVNGLGMLVAQAAAAGRMFMGLERDEDWVDCQLRRILPRLQSRTENVLLIGMPGCGKSSVGRLLAEKLGRAFFDADEELEKDAGCSIPEIFADRGEPAFRRLETQTLRRLTKLSGAVITTGGGAVTVEENLPLMRQNSRIVWLRRDVESLPTHGRPLSQANDLKAMYLKRLPLYQAAADMSFDNDGRVEDCVQAIIEALFPGGGEG